MPSAVLEEILGWFEAAVPTPNEKNLHTQLGVHFEEVAEMLETLEANDDATIALLEHATGAMRVLSQRLKTNDDIIGFGPDSQVKLLDALCDQMVTASGVGHMLGFDLIGALEEVNDSNWSKFGVEGPIFDENMKITKGPNYFKADLGSFV